MNPLHKAPQYLMDLFRLRTQGKQPDQFGTSIQPTVDVHAMYAADVLSTVRNTSGAAALPITVTTTSLAYSFGVVGLAGRVLIGANAGTRIAATIGVFLPSVGTGMFFPLFQSSSGQGGTPFVGMEFWVGGKLPGPKLVLPASAVVQLRVIGNQTGSDHVADLLMMLEGF